MNLGVAYQNFFRKLKDPRIPISEKGFPKFKKKNAKTLLGQYRLEEIAR